MRKNNPCECYHDTDKHNDNGCTICECKQTKKEIIAFCHGYELASIFTKLKNA